MYILVISVIILVSALLVLVVLAQNPKGGGLSSQFGGAGSSQIMGVKKTTDLLEKLTWGFAIALLLLTLSTNFFLDESNSAQFTSPSLESIEEQPMISTPSIDAESSELDGLELSEDSAQ